MVKWDIVLLRSFYRDFPRNANTLVQRMRRIGNFNTPGPVPKNRLVLRSHRLLWAFEAAPTRIGRAVCLRRLRVRARRNGGTEKDRMRPWVGRTVAAGVPHGGGIEKAAAPNLKQRAVVQI